MHPIEPSFRARLEAFKELKVKHPRLEEMARALTRAIHEHTSYTLLALYGPSGVGKSTVIKRIAQRCIDLCISIPTENSVPASS